MWAAGTMLVPGPEPNMAPMVSLSRHRSCGAPPPVGS